MRSLLAPILLAYATLATAGSLQAASLVEMQGYVAVRAPDARLFAYAEPLQSCEVGSVIHTRSRSGVTLELLPNVRIALGEYSTVEILRLDATQRAITLKVIEGSVIASVYNRLPVDFRIEGQSANVTFPVGLYSFTRIGRTEYGLRYRGDAFSEKTKRNTFGTRFVALNASQFDSTAQLPEGADTGQLSEVFRWLEQTGQSRHGLDRVTTTIVFQSLEELRKLNS